MKTKSELKKEYKNKKIPMGIYQIRNLSSGKVFIGGTANLDAIFNRSRFELDYGSHKNIDLQKDWDKLGEDKFEFTVLDYLEPKEGEMIDYGEELSILERLWLDKLQPYGKRGYNKEGAKTQKIR